MIMTVMMIMMIYICVCVCLYELLWLQMNMYYLQSGASGRSATIAFLLLRV